MSTVAAVDIGTNSTKLLVRTGDERSFHVADTRLGHGLHDHGVLAEDAMARTLDALAAFRRVVDEAGAQRLAVVATSATRDARNREEFLDRVHAALGVRPVVLSGADEARLAYLGASQDLPILSPGTPRLLLDIGGGSTEFAVGAETVRSVCSVDVGSVRLTAAELASDPPRADELSNAIGIVHDHLDDVLREIPDATDVATAVGIGGTITTVAAVELGRMDREQLHGFRLTRDAAEDVFRTLATEPLADRLHNPGLPASRAGVIVGGLCILVGVMRRLHLDELIVSQRTLVDGLCAELAGGRAGAVTGGRP